MIIDTHNWDSVITLQGVITRLEYFVLTFSKARQYIDIEDMKYGMLGRLGESSINICMNRGMTFPYKKSKCTLCARYVHG